MPDISIKDQLKKIVELQKIDAQIYELRDQLKEQPAVLGELKEKFEARRGALLGLEEKLKAVQVHRREQELELKTKEEEIVKANAQLSQIKTNKEYSAKIAEIEHIKADKSIIEEKILLAFDEGDQVSSEVEQEKSKFVQEEKSYLAKRKEVEDEVKVIEDRIRVLESQHKQGVEGIDPEFLNRYERILKNKGGIAIVPVLGNTCGGCYMNVTHQQINTLKMNDQLVFCEMCARIIYIEDGL